MDEITLFAELAPAPPTVAEETAACDRARARLAGTLTGPRPRTGAGRGTGRWFSRRRVVLGAAAALTAATAAVVVPAMLPGGGPPAVTTRAWAVEPGGHGTIRVTIRQLHDPAGLQRALRAEGVPAYVRYVPDRNTCSYEQDGGTLPLAAVQEAVLPLGPGGDPRNPYVVLTIDRRALPPGDAVLIQANWSPGQPDAIGLAPEVMGNDRPPVCVPLLHQGQSPR